MFLYLFSSHLSDPENAQVFRALWQWNFNRQTQENLLGSCCKVWGTHTHIYVYVLNTQNKFEIFYKKLCVLGQKWLVIENGWVRLKLVNKTDFKNISILLSHTSTHRCLCADTHMHTHTHTYASYAPFWFPWQPPWEPYPLKNNKVQHCFSQSNFTLLWCKPL